MDQSCLEDFSMLLMSIYGAGLFIILVILIWLLNGDVKLAFLHFIGRRSLEQPVWFKILIWGFLLLTFLLAVTLFGECPPEAVP